MTAQSKVLLGALGLAGALIAGPANAAVVYSNDFQTAVGSELSFDGFGSLGIDRVPVDANRRFLGWSDSAPTLGLNNHKVTLSLAGLAAHNQVTLSFDFYVINSWDGSGPTAAGPDLFTVAATGGPTLLNATFSNTGSAGNVQTYPNPHPAGPTVASRTGADESNSLGYGGFGDTVYNLSMTFAHTGGNLALTFTASGLQNLSDESWGLDNLIVDATSVPAPGTALLAALGLLGMFGVRRHRAG